MTAGKDISMMDEKEHHETIHEYHSHVSGLLSSKTKDLYEAGETDTVRGSLISGNETHMESGRDMTITGSAVVSNEDTTLLAGRNFKAESAEERSGSTYRESVKKRGLLSGGGLGFTMGSEKRKDRYDSEAVEQVGSTIGSVEGNVRIGAGKEADIEASHISAGKDLAISGKNVTITSKDNVYTNKEEHEYKRSGLSVSLGGGLVNTVNSVVTPLTRAGEVKDRRLSALYGLEAGKNLKGAVSGYMDNVKTIDAMKADMSRIDTLREAVKTDGIAAPMTESNLENIRDAEGKIMDKAKADNKARRNMSLDVSFGTAKSHRLSEERTIQAEGSTLHAKDTLTVKSGEDMTVKGSQMSAKDVYLKAGKDIRILSAENSSTTREKENSSSVSLGGSIGSSGLTGIRASYGRGREAGMGEEFSHTESTIKADHTLSLESGRDTDLKGSRIKGEKVQADVGGSLSVESEQDRKTYRENGKNTGISLGYDISSGKVSGFASAGKSHTDSHYESVTNQAGIYAGDKGFDITVKDNTHLKGAVIDSKGDAEKNTLRTGTLSWEDVENKADYKSGGMGISYAPKDSTTPLNARGLTPQMSPTVKDKAGSNTKAAIAKGTIVITDKKNQRQDISTMIRDTENSLNKLKEIFDKSRVEEKQELIQKVSQLGNEFIHEVSEQLSNQVNKDNHKADGHSIRPWEDGSIEKVMLHGALGAVVSYLSGSNDMTGAVSGGLNEIVIGYIKRKEGEGWVINHPDAVQAITTILGAAIGALTGDKQTSAYVSQTAAQWNALSKEQERDLNKQLQQLLDKKDFSIDELISVLQIYEDLGEVDEHTASIKVMKENPYNFSIYLQKKGENSSNIVYTLPGISVTAHRISEINQSLYNQIAKKYGLDVQWNENDDGLENVRQMLADAEWKRYGGHTWFQSKSAEYFGYGINSIETLTQETRYNYISGYAGTMGQVMDAMSFITDNDKVKNAAGLIGGFAGAQVGMHLLIPIVESLPRIRTTSVGLNRIIDNGIIIMATFSGQNLGNKIVDQQRRRIKEAIHEESKIDSEKDDDKFDASGKVTTNG